MGPGSYMELPPMSLDGWSMKIVEYQSGTTREWRAPTVNTEECHPSSAQHA